jgi:hypothetical protein
MAKEPKPNLMYRRLIRVAEILATVSVSQESHPEASKEKAMDSKKPQNKNS